MYELTLMLGVHHIDISVYQLELAHAQQATCVYQPHHDQLMVVATKG